MPVDGDALAEVIALRDRLDAQISEALGEFDAAELFELDGAVSTISWLRSRAGQSNRAATRIATTAKRLRRCPVTRGTWRDGSLSGGQIDAVVANLTPRRTPLWEDHEARVVPLLEPLDVRDTTIAMQAWAARADALFDEREPSSEPDRSLYLSSGLDGRRELSGTFDAETGEVLTTAIRLATTADLEGEPVRVPAQRRADALIAVCRWYLDHQNVQPAGRHRSHVNVTMTLRDLENRGQGRLDDGTPLDAEAIRRILCHSNIHRVLRGASSVLDYGRSTRAIPPPLYQALLVRDRGCRFPGCDRPGAWCDGHHIRHWADGGPTDMANLVLLCSRHHHRLHTAGWHLKLLPDATVEVTLPDGRTLTSRPPPDTS